MRPDAAPIRPTGTTLAVTITEGAGGPPIPGRYVLYGEDGLPLRIGNLDMYNGIDQDLGFCDLAPGVVGTWDGVALVHGSGEIAIGEERCLPPPAVPFGRYRLVALQGIEHEMFATDVDLTETAAASRSSRRRQRWTPTARCRRICTCTPWAEATPSTARVRVISELVTGIDGSEHRSQLTELRLLHRGPRLGADRVASSNDPYGQPPANVFPGQIEPAARPSGAPTGAELAACGGGAVPSLDALQRSPFVQLPTAAAYASYSTPGLKACLGAACRSTSKARDRHRLVRLRHPRRRASPRR